mgnify:CR=1 FL=1
MFEAELAWNDLHQAWVLRYISNGAAFEEPILDERDPILWDLAIHTSIHAPDGATGRVFVHRGRGHEIWLDKGHVDFSRTS